MRNVDESPFVVMAKPVGARCNLRCGYCYYSKTGGAETADTDSGSSDAVIAGLDSYGIGAGAKHSPRMSDETLELFIRQYFEAGVGPVVSFTWHGGEPTLAGLDFYRRAVELQKRWLPDGRECWNSLQTNGLLLDDEWCDFITAEHFDVGISIDGTGAIHDAYRKDRDGRGTYECAADAIRRLTTRGARPDLLCAVTADAAAEPLAVYRALRAFDTGWIQFIPIVRREPRHTGGVTRDSVGAEVYGDFLCTIFDEWASNDLGRLDVQLFAETAAVLAGHGAKVCWMAPVCGGALIVEADGSVYSCDHFVDKEHLLGDIYSSRLGDLAGMAVQREFGNAKRDSLPAECHACEWLSYCNGGCPKDRAALSRDGTPGLNILCAGLRRFFSHAVPTLETIGRLSRERLAPAAVSAKIRASLQSAWKGVGRNDPCPCGSGKKYKNCCLNKGR